MAESGDEKHAPVTVQQADGEHGQAAVESVPMVKTGKEFAKNPGDADDSQEIDDEKAALVEDVLEVHLFPDFRLVVF